MCCVNSTNRSLDGLKMKLTVTEHQLHTAFASNVATDATFEMGGPAAVVSQLLLQHGMAERVGSQIITGPCQAEVCWEQQSGVP